MTGKTLTIKNPSSKLLELVRRLKEEQEKRYKSSNRTTSKTVTRLKTKKPTIYLVGLFFYLSL